MIKKVYGYDYLEQVWYVAYVFISFVVEIISLGITKA